MNVLLECTSDFARFKKGEVFEFNQSSLLVGTNGSGKTTLLGAIRAKLSNSEAFGYWDQNFQRYETALSHFNVTTDFSKSLFCFGREDSGEAQTYDAISMIRSGGHGAIRKSRGEAALGTLGIKLGSDLKALKECLIVLDEVDTGFDLVNQFKFSKKLIPNLLKYEGVLLVTTHNYTTISNSNLPIYLLDKRKFVTLDELVNFMSA